MKEGQRIEVTHCHRETGIDCETSLQVEGGLVAVEYGGPVV